MLLLAEGARVLFYFFLFCKWYEHAIGKTLERILLLRVYYKWSQPRTGQTAMHGAAVFLLNVAIYV